MSYKQHKSEAFIKQSVKVKENVRYGLFEAECLAAQTFHSAEEMEML